jgi:hypothetical protein
MQRTIRSVGLALVLLVLAAGAVQARPLAVRSAPAGFLEGIWQWALAHLPSWTKAGSDMDPNGINPTLLTPLPITDEGSDMDPNGRK